jgi:hypothetical protein
MADTTMLKDNLTEANKFPRCSDALELCIAGAAPAGGERVANIPAGKPVQVKGHFSPAHKEL